MQDKYIYCFTNKINNKKYFGQTINPNSRYAMHKWNAEHVSDHYFYRSIRKYGLENFSFEIVAENLSWEEADQKEIELISEHNTIWPNGYNIAPGGTGKCPKIAKLVGRKNRKIWDQLSEDEKVERIERMRQSNLGREQTDFQKQKAMEANQRRWLITYPDGHTKEIVNLNKFCREEGLKYPNNFSTRGIYKGYKAEKL